ncbi:MAG: YdeI/OmpD-associated family protein [Pseudomonadota bacterium]
MQDLEITTPAALWDWLAAHHAQPESIRLITWKVHHADKYVSREAVLDALLAHGWIDGRRFVVDDDRTAQLIAPRQQQAWSQSYKDRVARLQAEGRMHPAGDAAVAAGHASGLWDFFADVDALILPPDLAAGINLAKWEAYAPSYRRNVLRWIKLAKTDKTRSKRIMTAIESTDKGEKIPQM